MAKLFTLSFDDGVTQDVRLIELLSQYGLTATFHLNSGLFGSKGSLVYRGTRVEHVRVGQEDAARVYRGFEVAAHTRTHPRLPDCSEERIVEEVVQDCQALSALVGYPVRGLSYPCGPPNSDSRVREALRRRTPILYARTVTATLDLASPSDWLQWEPSAHFLDRQTDALLTQFEAADEGLLYLWGHAYEFDAPGGWQYVQAVFERLASIPDAENLTNMQVYERLTCSA